MSLTASDCCSDQKNFSTGVTHTLFWCTHEVKAVNHWQKPPGLFLPHSCSTQLRKNGRMPKVRTTIALSEVSHRWLRERTRSTGEMAEYLEP